MIALDHIGLTVPDLETAVEFFEQAFECTHVFTAGPYDNTGWTWPGEAEPERLTLRLAVLRQGDTLNIELLEYRDRERGAAGDPPRPPDPGGQHIAFYVEDIHGVEQRLRKRGDVEFLNATEVEEGGPIDGAEWCYLRTSWGQVIELIRWEPGRLPYEAATRRRMIPPPWRREHHADADAASVADAR